MVAYFYAFLSIIIVSLISFVGAFFCSLKEDLLKKYIHIFISLAIGALLGDAFIHLIPEAFEKTTNVANTSLLIVLGILIFFILEKFLHWHHHTEDQDNHTIHPVGKLILFSDSVHNLIDGIIIGISFLISIPVGIATALAVILHEIPQEIGDFAVLIHAGYTKKSALWLNFISALTAILGLIIAIIFGNIAETFSFWILPIAAGGFIYIAMTDLIPELKETKKIKSVLFQILTILLGVLTMFSLLAFE